MLLWDEIVEEIKQKFKHGGIIEENKQKFCANEYLLREAILNRLIDQFL